MLEKPEIDDQLIVARLQAEYGLHVVRVAFLPIGADFNTAVYRLETEDGTAYFLKLRSGIFDELAVAIPQFLKDQGIAAVMSPLETKTGHLWGTLNASYRMILYPFIEGQDGFTSVPSDQQRINFGNALKAIHTAHLPPALKELLPQEMYSPHWRYIVRKFLAQIEYTVYQERVSINLAAIIRDKQDEIIFVVRRAEQLASQLKARPNEFVLCHSDVHAGNLLLSSDGALYIVDWDNPILAPKERDLMFIGSGVDDLWNEPRQANLFYQGYGPVEIDQIVLAYYRYERIVEDFAAYCEQLLATEQGGDDRDQSLHYFSSNFLPGGTIEIARRTDPFL